MWSDIAANLVTNPLGLMEIGWLAAQADLSEELAGLSRSGVPVLALRGHADGVVPLSAFQAMCEAVGVEGRIVKGKHSFLLSDPDALAEELAHLLLLTVPRNCRRPSAPGRPPLAAPAATPTLPPAAAGGATA